MPHRLRPHDPIFDPWKQRGAIDVGITPGIPINYDFFVESLVGAIWYSTLTNEEAPVAGTTFPNWETRANVYSRDLGDQSVWGKFWLTAWWSESGLAAADYDAVHDDAAQETEWFATLDTLGSAAASDSPWHNADNTFASGGRTYYEFVYVDDATSGYFWSADPGTFTVDVFLIGSGGNGGNSSTANELPGGGGAGEHVITTSIALGGDGGLIDVAGPKSGTPPASQGTDGESSLWTLASGTTYEAEGGSGGGLVGVSSGDGRSGIGSGGGGAAGVAPTSGTGGAGTGGGNAGGDGGGTTTQADLRAGGGGGAGAAGTTGVAGGQVGDGGDGVEYPASSGTYYGGGGAGRPGTGTATGGLGGGGNSQAAATNETGGGGGGSLGNAGLGGSGKVIISHVT